VSHLYVRGPTSPDGSVTRRYKVVNRPTLAAAEGVALGHLTQNAGGTHAARPARLVSPRRRLLVGRWLPTGPRRFFRPEAGGGTGHRPGDGTRDGWWGPHRGQKAAHACRLCRSGHPCSGPRRPPSGRYGLTADTRCVAGAACTRPREGVGSTTGRSATGPGGTPTGLLKAPRTAAAGTPLRNLGFQAAARAAPWPGRGVWAVSSYGGPAASTAQWQQLQPPGQVERGRGTRGTAQGGAPSNTDGVVPLRATGPAQLSSSTFHETVGMN